MGENSVMLFRVFAAFWLLMSSFALAGNETPAAVVQKDVIECISEAVRREDKRFTVLLCYLIRSDRNVKFFGKEAQKEARLALKLFNKGVDRPILKPSEARVVKRVNSYKATKGDKHIVPLLVPLYLSLEEPEDHPDGLGEFHVSILVSLARFAEKGSTKAQYGLIHLARPYLALLKQGKGDMEKGPHVLERMFEAVPKHANPELEGFFDFYRDETYLHHEYREHAYYGYWNAQMKRKKLSAEQRVDFLLGNLSSPGNGAWDFFYRRPNHGNRLGKQDWAIKDQARFDLLVAEGTAALPQLTAEWQKVNATPRSSRKEERRWRAVGFAIRCILHDAKKEIPAELPMGRKKDWGQELVVKGAAHLKMLKEYRKLKAQYQKSGKSAEELAKLKAIYIEKVQKLMDQ